MNIHGTGNVSFHECSHLKTKKIYMKTLKLVLAFMVTLIAISCQREEPLQKGSVQFSFYNIVSGNTGGRKQTDVIPDGASLLISISKSNGDSVFTWKKIELLNIGGHFITSPLPLLQGNYNITDFMIVGSDNAVLFVAPRQGSPLAALVQKPLPIAFSVSTNSVSNVTGEVIDADHRNPEDFGYASFGVKVVPSSGISVSALIIDDQAKIKFTNAMAYILQGPDTLLRKKLTPSVNNLYWKNNPSEWYTLVIVKDGYGKYKKDFELDSLTAQLGGKPLAITLKPALTFTWKIVYPTVNIFSIGGRAGAWVHIDWGDNQTQELQLPSTDEITHTYPTGDGTKYFVSITNDISSITALDFSYQINTSSIDTLSIKHLSALQSLTIQHSQYNGLGLDLSGNPKLEKLVLPLTFYALDIRELWRMRSLDIFQNPLINHLDIQGQLFPTPVVDKLIDDLYASATHLNIRNGEMWLWDVRSSPFPADSARLVGPPSPAQLAKLYSLKNDYGWFVYPISQ